MVKDENGVFVETTWLSAMNTVAQKMLACQGDEMSAIIGEFSDVESVVALKDLFNRFDCDNLETRSDTAKLNADLRGSYLMNSSIQGVEYADFLLLVGLNPRTEAPV